MSIFGKIKTAKKAAEAKKAQESTSDPQPVPYKHIPTHAALDALGGAPPRRHAEDRAAIRAAHHKRKSQISRENSGFSTPATSITAVYTPQYERRSPSLGYGPVGTEQRNSRSKTQFQSLTVPGNQAQCFPTTSQDGEFGHRSDGSNSSGGSYLEMPYVQPVKPLEDIVPSSTRRKFEKPSKLPGHLPVQHVPSKDKAASASVVEGAVPPARKRKAWMPFGHSKATAVAAH